MHPTARAVARRQTTRSSLLLGLGCALGVLCGGPGRASAEPTESRPALRFGFSAPEDCGDVGHLEQELGRRLPSLAVSAGDRTSPVQVALERGTEQVHASLVIRLEGGRLLRRELDAPSCEEAETAIAFVIGIALSPDAAEPLVVEQTPPPPPPPVEPEPEPEPATPTSTRFSLGAEAQASWGPSPGVLWGGGLTATLERRRVGWFSPSARLGFAYGTERGITEAAGTANFERWLGSVDLCPIVARWGWLSARPCASFAAGALIASGEDTYAAGRVVRPWVEPGVTQLLDIALGEHLTWSSRVMLGFPLIRDAFQFDSLVFHQVPPLAATLSSGFAVTFP